MKKEQLEARKQEIVTRLNELKKDVAPVSNRINCRGSLGVENQTKVVYKTSGWYWWSYGSKPNQLDDFIQHHKQKSS